MAAFAAIHYKTGVVDDIHAYGALATIEEFLKNWFAARDLWPSESSIRKRARTLLEAYRSVDMNEVK
jgi:hypothetical protein